MANSFAYNSVDLAGASYGITVEAFDEHVLAAPVLSHQQAAQGYSGYVRASRYGAKVFKPECWLEATSLSNLTTQVDNIKFLLNPLNGLKRLQFDYWTDRYWKAILQSEIKPPHEYAPLLRFPLEFIAPDCRAFSTTTTTDNLTVDSNPDTWSITPAGTADAEVEWIIKNTSGSAASVITLTNSTRSESLTYGGTLANGDWLRVRSDEYDPGGGMVELSSNSGSSWAAVMSGLWVGFLLPKLSPRVANTIALTGIPSGTLSVTYIARYL